jgi:hypothetical protein
MSELDQRLRKMFAFEEFDVRANRAGRMSRRQEALLQVAGRNVRLGFFVFAVVLLGSVAFVGFLAIQAGGSSPSDLLADPGMLTALGVVVAVAVAVIGIGAVLTQRYTSNLSARQFSVARGEARVAHNAAGNWQIRIGVTRLRLPSEDHLQAFRPGVEYRVFYLPGAMPMILSAETTAGDRPDTLRPLTAAEEAALAAKDPGVRGARYAWLVVAALGVMALGIPVAGVLSAALPAWQRCVVMGGLFALAVGYVPLALRLVSPRRK